MDLLAHGSRGLHKSADIQVKYGPTKNHSYNAANDDINFGHMRMLFEVNSFQRVIAVSLLQNRKAVLSI
jgi:hypothetical protein